MHVSRLVRSVLLAVALFLPTVATAEGQKGQQAWSRSGAYQSWEYGVIDAILGMNKQSEPTQRTNLANFLRLSDKQLTMTDARRLATLMVGSAALNPVSKKTVELTSGGDRIKYSSKDRRSTLTGIVVGTFTRRNTVYHRVLTAKASGQFVMRTVNLNRVMKNSRRQAVH